MSIFAKLKDALLNRQSVTSACRSEPSSQAAVRVDELPPFNLHTAELMRFDPQVRIGLGARNGLLAASEVEVTGPDKVVVAWARRQWNRIWTTSASMLLRAKLYGFAPFEVMYREQLDGLQQGLLEVDHLKDRHPRDVRILQSNCETVGFSLRTADDRWVDLLAPKALVVTFDGEFGNPYGRSLLERAYPSWYEKWMEGGVKKMLRLRMIKDAYIGDLI